jgi:hypothetical protein
MKNDKPTGFFSLLPGFSSLSFDFSGFHFFKKIKI